MFAKKCETSQMSCVEYEAAQLLKRAAGPAEIGSGVKAAIGRAARRLGWPFNRAREIWYGRARVRVREMDQLRRICNEQAQEFERVANAMATIDPDFYQQRIADLCDAARAIRNMGGRQDQS